MRALAFALVYVAFFVMVGFAVWFTESAWALLALLLTPSIKMSTTKKKPKKEKVNLES